MSATLTALPITGRRILGISRRYQNLRGRGAALMRSGATSGAIAGVARRLIWLGARLVRILAGSPSAATCAQVFQPISRDSTPCREKPAWFLWMGTWNGRNWNLYGVFTGMMGTSLRQNGLPQLERLPRPDSATGNPAYYRQSVSFKLSADGPPI